MLAAVIAAALATNAVHAAEPASVPSRILQVTNCDDAGSGSLRDAFAAALDNDFIDLTSLQCSVITLTSGEVSTGVDNVTVQGNGQTIDAGGMSRVVDHTGTGRLSLKGLTIENGAVVGIEDAAGGCVRGYGDVYLADVRVQNCLVHAGNGFTSSAVGGGVASSGDLTLERSSVFNNRVQPGSGTYAYARGGGVESGRHLTLDRSAISGNAVEGSFGNAYWRGGGFHAWGHINISYSTISGNSAPSDGAGFIADFPTYGTSRILNSTISGNSSPFGIGGITSFSRVLEVWGSTIAFNVGGYSSRFDELHVATKVGFDLDRGPSYVGGGIGLLRGHADLRGSIIADNVMWGIEDDVYQDDFNNGVPIAGYRNLIPASRPEPPPDTVRDDPMLAPLANNGGPTDTHALLPGSPAIDGGTDDIGTPHDQRGVGYARISGLHADIGAFEVQQPPPPDGIFENGFD